MEIETSKKIISWQEQLKNSLHSVTEFTSLAKEYNPQYLEYINTLSSYPFTLPRELAFEILRLGPESFLWKQFIPAKEEDQIDIQSTGLVDPIGDQTNFVAPQLIHRYLNRVLFLPTATCPIQCRYCFRKNELHNPDFQHQVTSPQFEKTQNYLSLHPEVEEIIFTGGDPLMLSDNKIDAYLKSFSQFENLKFIRFHTRFITSIPERIDTPFLALLEKWSTRFCLSLMIHTNHLSEWFLPTQLDALKRLSHLKIHLGSQTVLLKNHQTQDLVDLFKFLITHQVRPYYLHHPDQVKGAMHFSISLDEGLKIYNQLRQKLPGWAIPHYVQDSPTEKQKRLVSSILNENNRVLISH